MDTVTTEKAGRATDSVPQTRKIKAPRKASTYRAARRNDVLRGEIRGKWKAPKAKYLPYYNFGAVMNGGLNGKQAKARRAHQLAKREAA